MRLQIDTNLKLSVRLIGFILIWIFFFGCTKSISEQSGKTKDSYIPVAYQKKQDLKPMRRKEFFKLYGEYSKKNHPYPARQTKISGNMKGNFIYLSITISPGCYIKKNILSLNFRDAPFTSFPLYVNKYHQNLQYPAHERDSPFYNQSNHSITSRSYMDKIYAKQVNFRFPVKLLLKFPNRLMFTLGGQCFNREKNKRQSIINNYKSIVFDIKSKTLKLENPKDRIGMGDPDGPY